MPEHNLGHKESIPKGSGKKFELEGREIAVFRTEDDEFCALNDRCTHAEASLSQGYLEGTTIECPLHGARFDIRTGEVRALPAVVSERTYPVRIEEDHIVLTIPDEQ